MTETAAPTVLQRDHRSARGTITYLSHKPDRWLQERGREYFHIDVHRTASARSPRTARSTTGRA